MWIRAMLAGALALAAAAPGAAQAVRGRAWAADGSSAAGVRVTVSAGAWADSADTDAEGRFAVPLAAGVEGDSLRVAFDGGAAGAFLRSEAALPRARWDDEVRAVLVPRRWTVRAGVHAGEAVELSMEEAFAPPCTGCNGGFFRPSVGGRGGQRAPVPAWRARSFPLRVAFDHAYTSEPITARDSAAFWGQVAGLHRDVGMQLFRPTPFAETAPADDGPDDVVLVWVERGMRAAGLGSVAYGAGGDIDYGSVRLGDAALLFRPEAQRLVAHELVHTLGVGHTCAWVSLMADVTRCPSRHADAATARDVAYLHLHLAVSALQRAHRATLGLDAALRGERNPGLRVPDLSVAGALP